ncbi:hypothetical protein BpHYR1_022172 [Brachionus plicatilis]|uniref:Uncharacterized protein n=1 Tax=Brachionus plicatilis TaxID=10195 RepID=A0A3M7QG89_BRAPC|nr:hypothetical protein BpHYR1_022172 [Brachionus plicatilis]
MFPASIKLTNFIDGLDSETFPSDKKRAIIFFKVFEKMLKKIEILFRHFPLYMQNIIKYRFALCESNLVYVLEHIKSQDILNAQRHLENNSNALLSSSARESAEYL